MSGKKAEPEVVSAAENIAAVQNDAAETASAPNPFEQNDLSEQSAESAPALSSDLSVESPGESTLEDVPEEMADPTTALNEPGPAPAKKRRSSARKKPPSAISEEEPTVEVPPAVIPQEPVRSRNAEPSILTIASKGEVDTPDDQAEIAWHEIRNAYLTRRILTGILSGIEPTKAGNAIAVVNYNNYRVLIPLSEMMITLKEGPNNYGEMQLRQSKILGSMIGAEVDFVIKGIEMKSRSIAASRKDAMIRKRKLFYFDLDSQGMYRIYEGRIVQARVIAVAEKVVRVEVFGVECPILARDLSYNWLGDAHDYYHVGDKILIRIQEINRKSLDTLSIRADVKSLSGDTDRDNLEKCRIQGKYAGTVTDIHRGVVFVRLNIGVNAIAHSCYDSRMPGKKDEVSFVITHLDEDRNVAVGIITRILRRKL